MKHDESGNEDLMREAVSLIERIEFRSPSLSGPITLGLNKQAWLFVYLGDDPMYRFDQQGRLRRAFVDGFLFRSAGQTLVRLERTGVTDEKATTESVLLRRTLTPTEFEEFRDRTRSKLAALSQHLSERSISRQYPESATNLAARFQSALQTVLEAKEFLAPAIVRRRRDAE